MEKKEKIKGLLLVVALLLLIAGTYTWFSFTQRAINDRHVDLGFEEVGRLHDYFDEVSGNKDVFVENFGDAPILVRIKLLEYMEIDGVSMVQADAAADTDVQPLKADPTTWTPWIPAASGNTVGDRVGAGAVFNSRARWTMGWQPRVATDGSGQLLDAPYYMPTFNHSRTDHKTVAAGDGRDWNWSGEEADTSASPNGTNAGADATGVTHPGDGTDGYWNAGDTATSLLGTPPDTQSGTHTARQTVVQDQPVMLLSQWNALSVRNRIGNFWVVDPQTGWAYWANMLFPGEATSFLLDQATFITSGLRGNVYYGIKVVPNMVANTDNTVNSFWSDDENHSDLAKTLIDEVRHGLPILGELEPGDIFTLRGTEYRYLENKGNGNHLVITNFPVAFGTAWNASGVPDYNGSSLDLAMRNFHDTQPSVIRRQVQPVQSTFPNAFANEPEGWLTWNGGGFALHPPEIWLGSIGDNFNFNHSSVPAAMRDDLTTYTPGGERKAFALSMADLAQVTGPNRGFPDVPSRVNGQVSEWWFLRTLARHDSPWYVNGWIGLGPVPDASTVARLGQIFSDSRFSLSDITFGGGMNPPFTMRPALILHDQDGAWTSGL